MPTVILIIQMGKRQPALLTGTVAEAAPYAHSADSASTYGLEVAGVTTYNTAVSSE